MAKRKQPPGPDGGVPVDLDRLRKQFPELTEEDLAAYSEVTRTILAAAGPAERARVTRQALADARAARARFASGATLSGPEIRAVRYLDAIEKMQGPKK